MAGAVVYLLCGVSGSGKTSHARRLEAMGFVRLSVDEIVHARHGVQDVDYPTSEYPRLHAEALAELDRRLDDLLRAGSSVVLDYGMDLWKRSGREHYKRVVEAHGGRWILVYFKADRDLLKRRLAERNRRSDANSFFMTDARIAAFLAELEEPSGEGEVVRRQR